MEFDQTLQERDLYHEDVNDTNILELFNQDLNTRTLLVYRIYSNYICNI